MENKTTTELINLLSKLVDGKGNLKDGWDECWEKLINREPFYTLMNSDSMVSNESLMKQIEELQGDIKKLKRHKHDPHNGDVLARV